MSLNILENIILEKRKEVAKLLAAMPIGVVQELSEAVEILPVHAEL